MFHRGYKVLIYILVCIFKCVYGKHKPTYMCMYIHIYYILLVLVCLCAFHNKLLYRWTSIPKIDTVQCKRVYLSAKGVSTQQVPLSGTVLLVNECMCVFCAEVFLLLVGFFWKFVHYTLYRKQSFSRPSERQHPCAVALFFPSSSSFDFFLHFLLDVLRPIQWENEIKGLSRKSTPLFGRSSLEWSCNYPSCLVVPFRQLFAML